MAEILVAELHGRLLRRVSSKRHYQCLGVAARDLRRSNVLLGKVGKRLQLLDTASSVCRHITMAYAKSLYDEVDAYCSKHDPPLPAATGAATAPTPTTDTSHRATSMTTSIADFLELPVPVIEYVAPAPDVTNTEPDPETEHATSAPVIEYIAPSPAVSYPFGSGNSRSRGFGADTRAD